MTRRAQTSVKHAQHPSGSSTTSQRSPLLALLATQLVEIAPSPALAPLLLTSAAALASTPSPRTNARTQGDGAHSAGELSEADALAAGAEEVGAFAAFERLLQHDGLQRGAERDRVAEAIFAALQAAFDAFSLQLSAFDAEQVEQLLRLLDAVLYASPQLARCAADRQLLDTSIVLQHASLLL